MLVKIHKSYRNVIAICDSELIGKKFEDGEFQLDLTGEFFKGENLEERKVKELIEDATREDSTFNIVGKKSVDLALACKVVGKEGVKKVQGVPFAFVLL